MHGLILAGGLGSRLAADGVEVPKPLVRVGGRPQLLRVAETLDRLGCATVTCLVREGVAAEPTPAPRARVVPCVTPSSLHTLVLGFAEVPPGPVFCAMVDTVMSWESWRLVWTAWRRADDRGATALLGLAPRPAHDAGALLARTDSAGRVTALGAAAAPSELATAGVYGFAPEARPLASALVARGAERMRGFLTALVDGGHRVESAVVARALDLDRRRDLDEANAWAPAGAPP